MQCCGLKNRSKFCPLLCSKLVPFFFFRESCSPCRKMRIFPKRQTMKPPERPKSCVKNWSNFVARHTWTNFWHNLFCFFLCFVVFWQNHPTPPIFIVFSAKHANFKETQKRKKKKKNTICEHTRASCSCQNVRFLCFCIFQFCFFCNIQFLERCFFDR